MADIDLRTTDRGQWLTARSEHGVEVSAYRRFTEDDEPGPFTIFWQGRTGLSQIQEFAAPYFRSDIEIHAIVLTLKQRLEFAVSSPSFLQLRMPDNARFLRLECRAKAQLRAEPDPVIWARLGAFDRTFEARGRSDDIGVLLSSSQLSEIEDRLLQFVLQTHMPKARADTLMDCFGLLDAYLGPGANTHVYA